MRQGGSLLKSLSIRNIVLIEEADVDFDDGLCVLTGETGSGKSIFLDALMLAVGVRSSSRLLRDGKKSGSVTAVFDIQNNGKCRELLRELEIESSGDIILRRVLTEDGKSKAFVNDVMVGQNFLNTFGAELVEVHGQHDQRGLLNPSFHRDILDQYANLAEQRQIVSNFYYKMKSVEQQLQELTRQKESIEREVDYLEYIIDELRNMAIEAGEEEELNSRRVLLMNREKIMAVLGSVKDTVEKNNPVSKSITGAQNYLSRNRLLGENFQAEGQNMFDAIVEDFEKCIVEFNEGMAKIESIYRDLDFDGSELDRVEERLFSLKNLSRKYNVDSNNFPKFIEETEEKLREARGKIIALGDMDSQLKLLESDYLEEAGKLRNARRLASKRLEGELSAELAMLRMDSTRFEVEFRELDEDHWGASGIDGVKFMVAVNAGTSSDDLSKVASGGELSRFMLALRVVLLRVGSASTMIFDEIDSGVSGAVADVVGERLKRLGQNFQVFVVTHLPQIASKGHSHFKISKETRNDRTYTMIEKLDQILRKNEIAKMLSARDVTEEALRAAEMLLQGSV
ncbi:MAG: DNA repair protein RecN [Rickettsiales bacterium]|jgi:DNA repair protein RecN (Recombination protein N)|nr:DNA repair protein RecN [Rickettsiales bacterium]